jgi:hypothetical protein
VNLKGFGNLKFFFLKFSYAVKHNKLYAFMISQWLEFYFFSYFFVLNGAFMGRRDFLRVIRMMLMNHDHLYF